MRLGIGKGRFGRAFSFCYSPVKRSWSVLKCVDFIHEHFVSSVELAPRRKDEYDNNKVGREKEKDGISSNT